MFKYSCHPYSKFSDWKFKLFRVRSMEEAPLPSEPPLEKEVQLRVDVQWEAGGLPGRVM